MLYYKRRAGLGEVRPYLADKQREAIVQCLTDRYGQGSGLSKYRYYKSIAASEKYGGSYLIIDDEMHYCWVQKQLFKPVFDPFGILR